MADDRKKIYKGSDRDVNVTIRDQNGDPFDLTNITHITACFDAADGTKVQFTLADTEIAINGNAVLGKLIITMSDTKTALLEAGERVDFEVILDEGVHPTGIRKYAQFKQLIDIIETGC